MRETFTKTLTQSEAEDLLTTGEAAQLLGTSRQHVVDLCNAGYLPFVTVGRHRRVSRRDVEALRAGTRRWTRDQLRSLWLSHAVAGRLVEDPQGVLARARNNLAHMFAGSARGSAKIWLQKWQQLLDGPVEGVLEALTSRSPMSRELRQNSPFAGVLTEAQRRTALSEFSRAHHERILR
ncbi:MAG: helix-turn-helix domain-containing protein [Gemmatimonadales bacterium]